VPAATRNRCTLRPAARRHWGAPGGGSCRTGRRAAARPRLGGRERCRPRAVLRAWRRA